MLTKVSREQRALLNSKNLFDKAYFMFLNGLQNNWKLVSKLHIYFKDTDISIEGSSETNLQRIVQKFRSNKVEDEEENGPFRLTDMVRVNI